MAEPIRDPVSELDDEDRLSLEIGRVARAHVRLDNMLRELHRTLAYPGLAILLTGGITSTDRLIEDCRLMLVKADTTEAIIRTGVVVLGAVEVANVERNRVVHDMWIRDLSSRKATDPPLWKILRGTTRRTISAEDPDPLPRDLPSVEAVLTSLARAEWRLRALRTALWETLPYLGANHLPPTAFDWVAVMEDRFDLLPANAIRVPD